MQKQNKTRELTYLGMSIASLIGGGLAIYLVASFLPIPGVKYIMLSPLLSLVIYIVLSHIKGKIIMLKFGFAFGAIMSMMNLYMGLAILTTTIMTQLSILFYRGYKYKAMLAGILFAFYTGVSSLLISKYMIGGIFSEIALLAIILVGLACSIFGFIGSFIGKRVYRLMQLNRDE